MASKINVGNTDFNRTDMFWVDPNQVVIREELRGRHKPPPDEAIIRMALSLHEYGQRQPVECRKMADNRLMLNMGFTRTAAARLLREGFDTTNDDGEKVFLQDPDFRLKVVITEATDESAFVNNVVENCHRNQTSVIDDAYNQAKLRDRYGKANSQITRLYAYGNPNKVGQLQNLLRLPQEYQDMIHDGTMSVDAGLQLLDVPQEKWPEIIKDATNAKGKIVAVRVASKIRSDVLSDEETGDDSSGSNGNDAGTTTNKGGKNKPNVNGTTNRPKRRPLTLAELRKFIDGEVGTNSDPERQVVKRFWQTMSLFLKGERKEDRMREAVDALFKA